jgi:hypothetical protein
MRSLLTIFQKSASARAPETAFGPSSHSLEEVLEEHSVVLLDVLERAGIDRDLVSVEIRQMGPARDGRNVLAAMVRLTSYNRHGAQRLLLGLPFIERAVRRKLHNSWVREVSLFGGVWLHASTKLIEGDALEDLKSAISRLEDDDEAPSPNLAGSTWAALG